MALPCSKSWVEKIRPLPCEQYVTLPCCRAFGSVRIADAPAPSPAAKDTEESVSEDKLCRSPVTGIVIKINVVPGQTIQANDLIMVLEAMKMETNVTGNRAGTVKSVRVAQGGSVKLHQVVAEFE